MGDFNGDLGNSSGEKSAREPNQHGLKLLELTDYFNLCPIYIFWDYMMGLLIHLFFIAGDIIPHVITLSCPAVCSMKYTMLKRLI